jgi:hypothetical protein
MLKLTPSYFPLALTLLINIVLYVKCAQVDLQAVYLYFLNLQKYRQKDIIETELKNL